VPREVTEASILFGPGPYNLLLHMQQKVVRVPMVHADSTRARADD